jgi:hypothetical protein
MRKALNHVSKMLNLVNGHYRNADYRHDVNGSSLGGDALVFALRRLEELERRASD